MTAMLHHPHATTPARIYFDVDGVICADAPLWGDAKTVTVRIPLGIARVTYSPHIVHTLDRFDLQYGVELVAVTSWLEDQAFNLLTEELGALSYARHLPIPAREGVAGELPTFWKRDAIIDDLRQNPAPFAWIDDDEVHQHGVHVAAVTDQPALLLAPNTTHGLTSADLCSIERFIGAHAAAPSTLAA